METSVLSFLRSVRFIRNSGAAGKSTQGPGDGAPETFREMFFGEDGSGSGSGAHLPRFSFPPSHPLLCGLEGGISQICPLQNGS